MVEWTQLLLPILVSTVVVFVASSVIHMVLQWHTPDYRKLANEDEVRAAIRAGAPAPAQYIFPHCTDAKEAATEAMKRKFEEGPVGVLYVKPSGQVQLGPFLRNWTLYVLVVVLLVAYVTRAARAPGASFTAVLQVAAVTGWLAFSWQGPADSVWKGKPWSATARDMVDGLVYGTLTGVIFAWMWPGA
jgi:hypothetical protein